MADIKAEYLACPIRQVVSRFGDKWSLLVLFLLNRSDTGVLRFNEIRRFMTDCSQKMLSQTSGASRGLSRGSPTGGVFPNRYRQIIDACPHSPHRLG